MMRFLYSRERFQKLSWRIFKKFVFRDVIRFIGHKKVVTIFQTNTVVSRFSISRFLWIVAIYWTLWNEVKIDQIAMLSGRG